MFEGFLLIVTAVLLVVLGTTFYKQGPMRPLGFNLMLFSVLVFMMGVVPVWDEQQLGGAPLGVAVVLWLGSLYLSRFLTITKLQQHIIAIVIVFIFGTIKILKDEVVDIYELLLILAFLFWYAVAVVQREIFAKRKRV